MHRKALFILLILASISGVIGAALSVAMVIRAVQWSEWGRVLVYSVTTAVCVEMTVLSIGKMRSQKSS